MSATTFPPQPYQYDEQRHPQTHQQTHPQTHLQTQQQQERIWYQDPRGFVRADRLARFVPEPRTGIDAQLNAIMRFSIYLAAVASLLRMSLAPAVAILSTAALVTFLVHKADADVDGGRRERLDVLGLEVDPSTRQLCSRPTEDNPFMNVLLSDYQRFPERPRACDVTRERVRDRVEDLAAHNLYVDSDDIYGRRANASQFYTNAATTIPNDQGGFARWLYQPAPAGRGTCREGDGDACLAKVFRPYL